MPASAATAATTRAPPQDEGRFAGPHHLALLAMLAREERSGTLEVRSGERRLWVCLIGGRIAWADADGAGPSLVTVLAAQGVLDKDRLKSMLREVGNEDSLMRRVSDAVGQPRSKLEPLRHELVRGRLAAPVAWDEGQWRFSHSAASGPKGIDPRLFPDFGLPRVGWLAVQRHVSRDRMRADVHDPVAGSLRPVDAEELARTVSELPLPGALDPLGALLSSPITLSRLRDALGGEPPELVPALWLLERGGWLVRSNREVVGPSPPSQPPRGGRSSDALLAAERSLARHWAARHDEDFYDLLDVRHYASISSIHSAVEDARRRWGPLARDPHRDTEARRVAASMLAAVELAQSVLSDEGRRQTYDEQRKAGAAAAVGSQLAALGAISSSASTTGRPASSGDPLEAVQERLHDGDFVGALDPARQAWLQDPDNPGALAELAWVSWNTRDRPEGQRVIEEAGEPDMLLARALAIDPGHTRARRVRDDIARQRSAGEGTRNTLMGWLRGRE